MFSLDLETMIKLPFPDLPFKLPPLTKPLGTFTVDAILKRLQSSS